MKVYQKHTKEDSDFVPAGDVIRTPERYARFALLDNRSETLQRKEIHASIKQSPEINRIVTFQESIHAKMARPKPMIQRKENKTGLPDSLKVGIEELSGYSMDDVKVHYNSPKPVQLSAHAYAQGTDIHLGPGQEKHLPHESWHVVQQKQGRVRPTMQMKGGVNVNDDKSLEQEADRMGERAVRNYENKLYSSSKELVNHEKVPPEGSKNIIQRNPFDLLNEKGERVQGARGLSTTSQVELEGGAPENFFNEDDTFRPPVGQKICWAKAAAMIYNFHNHFGRPLGMEQIWRVVSAGKGPQSASIALAKLGMKEDSHNLATASNLTRLGLNLKAALSSGPLLLYMINQSPRGFKHFFVIIGVSAAREKVKVKVYDGTGPAKWHDIRVERYRDGRDVYAIPDNDYKEKGIIIIGSIRGVLKADTTILAPLKRRVNPQPPPKVPATTIAQAPSSLPAMGSRFTTAQRS